MRLPNATPRPPGELAELERIWDRPRGWRIISAVNNNIIGIFYVGTALLFFVLAGILALVMRTQLAVPNGGFVGHDLYNQLFTMHGTVMMFLFAVPVVEALGVYLLPNLQAARDLPFPRLSAYAFWAYFVGGLVFFTSIFFDVAPRAGWFMYPPLSSTEYEPGISADFWLLGIGFIEISAIAGAVEIVVGVLKTRAPGQGLDKLPVYSWAMLVFAAMIIFAFPAVILCTLLLELERAFDWPFFIAERGGDPLLWQHLFWFFGHPEVYIIFLPAAGMVSMIVPSMAQSPLVGYRLVVLAILGTGFLSFGLWVHHMFTTGLPELSLSFFSAASMAVSIPSGIQVFAWIATIARGKMRLHTPALFILGFLFIFTLGGLTGVMVAMMPFDWQVHDTYFVVAHFHYVLIGGMVFPLFAAFYYWAPTASVRMSETIGRWVFALIFVGVNVTFFTMHITGLRGMPRRVWTYPDDLGWNTLNAVSTGGAFVIAAGVALFLFDLARRFRPFRTEQPGNVWNAGTLEWLPSGNYQTRSVPIVTSREPLWDQPNLAEDVKEGRYYLPGAPTGGRETIVTSPIRAEPQYLLRIPGPAWSPVLAAIFTAGFFLLLTVKLVPLSVLSGVLAVAFVLVWVWDTDPDPDHPPVAIGGGIVLPVYATGPVSHAWWAMVVLMLVGGSLFACTVFSYLFLWLGNAEAWPPPGAGLPHPAWPAGAVLLYLAGAGAVLLAGSFLARGGGAGNWPFRILLVLAVPLLVAAFGADLLGLWRAGVRPSETSYGAIVFGFAVIQGLYVAALVVMAPYTVARSFAGLLDARRRVTFDNTRMLWLYAVAQGLIALALVHLFPRLVG
ncbi:cbb3-type cytochrome c oxidase subunit I [Propylenella binzhouense]|uniref:Cytochrome ubiquinol oxidase subunit I n=1 Tax=Propylenella binzhouense TaxID=2555902 RepID=A0A964T5R8_9HYPH|nr:cbb3-type cytochrome c oxidase subunit I [Propylenella binzhouense]MYZ48930.1 cytochrome ubiquinol oxidase subunit I [Propylenella binzhouense]